MLEQEYDLGGKRSEKPQFYISRHEMVYHANNSKQKIVDEFEQYRSMDLKVHMVCHRRLNIHFFIAEVERCEK
jgi:hypothetical protein